MRETNKILNYKIAYVVADLKRIGPTNQTLNIIKHSGSINNCVVITLFDELEDTQIQEYIDCGINVICLHLNRKTALALGVNALKKELMRQKPNLVHSWGTFADILSYKVCKKCSYRHIITLRNFPVEEMTTRMPYAIGYCIAMYILHILKHSKNVVCCSKSIKKKLEKSYQWSHLSSIQNGVDFERFKACDRESVRRELGLKEDDVVYISTGSIIPRKRIEETADAFNMASLPDNYKLWFLGDGNLLSSLKEKYAFNQNIIFLGKKKDVSYYLSAADVFVSSSESEGMPNAVLEAIACNLPVFLSDIPQHKEIIDSIFGCGKTYKLGDVNAFSELFLKTTVCEYQTMKEQTKELYNSDLTMEKMGAKYNEYYQSIEL